MDLADIVQIPGNIKNSYIPFIRNPTANVHLDDWENSPCLTNKKGWTVFSFRDKPINDNGDDNNCRINLWPESIKDMIKSDISFIPNKISDISAFIKDLPIIQIREFQPDSKLDQILNFVDAIKDGWDAATSGSDSSESNNSFETFKQNWEKGNKSVGFRWAKIQALTQKIWDTFTDGEFIESIASETPETDIIYGSNTDHANYILRFPYILYYRLMSTVTNNFYEFPYSPTELYSSNGQAGWNGNKSFGFAGTSNNSIIGKFLNFMAPNLAINASPIWQPGSYDNSSINIDVDLINDTRKNAINNFLMILSIIGNNFWMQYHIMQYSPSLYDIKLDGIGRHYMCSGSFKCTPVGTLRSIPDTMWKELTGTYNNSSYKDNTFERVKIPDAYHLSMTFTSLLPNNFNNFLYSLTAKDNVMQIVNGGAYTQNLYTDVAKAVSDKVVVLKNYWNSSEMMTDMEAIK